MNASENTRTDDNKRPVEIPAAPTELPSIPLPTASASLLKEMRKRRARKLLRQVLLLVVLPTVVSLVYFCFLASPEYESTSIFVVEHRESRTSSDSLSELDAKKRAALEDNGNQKASAKLPSAKPEREDAQIALEYILSRDMLDQLDRAMKLRDHYSSPNVDFFSRLSRGSSREAAYQYLTKKLHVVHDTGTSALTLKLRAFDGETAAKASSVILSSTERMLNRILEEVRNDKLKLAELEVERLRRVVESEPQESGNPGTTTESAKPAIRAAKVGERSDAPHGRTLSEAGSRSRRRLAQAEEQLQLLRDEASLKERYVVRVAGPSLPDEASYPQRGRAVLATLLFSALAMGILSLLFSAVREHTNL